MSNTLEVELPYNMPMSTMVVESVEGQSYPKQEDLTDAFLKWSEMMDRRRKQNFSQVFPEWCKVLEQNGYKYQYK